MAAGDLVVADYQLELRATLMGPTTDFGVQRTNNALGGLVDAVTKLAETEFAHADGSFVGESHEAARTANIPLLVSGATATARGDNIETMLTVWESSSETLPLYFQFPGFGKRYVNGRPLGLTPDLGNLVINPVRCLASFRITDPTIHS